MSEKEREREGEKVWLNLGRNKEKGRYRAGVARLFVCGPNFKKKNLPRAAHLTNFDYISAEPNFFLTINTLFHHFGAYSEEEWPEI